VHEPLSPELALVDPELAARARAALPDRALALADAHAHTDHARTDEVRERPSFARFVRGAVLLALVASLTLNVNLLAEHQPAGQERVVAPNASAVEGAIVVKTSAARRPGPRRTRTSASLRHPGPTTAPRKVPATTLRWRRSDAAAKYDVVIWQGHRRVLDVWTTRPRVDLSALPCAERRKLPTGGRYLWFVYPLLRGNAPARFGALLRWGVVPPAVAVSCRGTPGAPSKRASASRRP
jgi:hypothetical protein